MNSVEEKLLQFQTLVVEVLIRNAEDIGFVSDSLYERTLLMTECFGTDDELDASSKEKVIPILSVRQAMQVTLVFLLF
jgi:hypothetical protein